MPPIFLGDQLVSGGSGGGTGGGGGTVVPPVSGVNPIVNENALVGVSAASAGASSIGRGEAGFLGFVRQFSRNVGQSVSFSVDGVNATNIAIHRIGHYGGTGWRLVEVLSNTATSQSESQVLANSNGARTCSNWTTTATWNIPPDAVSGLYVGVVRDSGNTPRSWIPFVVREDGRTADIVLRVSDSTWGGAYNSYGTKAAPFDGRSVYGTGVGGSRFDIQTRGLQMSYDRPIVTRGTASGDYAVNHWDILESALIDWVEKNGYNVKYISCYDLDQGLGVVGNAKILACAGHDEYWSDGMLNNTEAFIASGGHHVSMSANSQFWRIRWADGGRTFWCYKDTMPGPSALRTGGAGVLVDPVSWTGTWRDTRWAQRRPESLLLGATFRMNGINDETMVVNGAANQAKPFWRSTTVAGGSDLTVTQVIGFEADSLDFPNAGGVNLGSTTINIDGAYANDNGENYSGNGDLVWGIACHYPRAEGNSGLGVHFGTNQWMWGLSDNHRRGGAVANREMRQATYNLLTDLGAAAATREGDLTQQSPVSLSAYGATRPSGGTTLPSVSVAVSSPSVLEDGAAHLLFTFTRTQMTGALSVNFATGGTAQNGVDYSSISSPVVFADGSATATLVVNPSPDTTSESDETVSIAVTAGTGYVVGSPASAVGTIQNDDAAPAVVTVAPGTATLAEDAAGNLSFVLTRAGGAAGSLAVSFTLGGTASSGVDYTASATSSVTFSGGATTATVTIDPTTDITGESNETVTLTVTAGSGYSVGSPSTATVTITNDDALPTGILRSSFVSLPPGTTSKSAPLGFTPAAGNKLIAICAAPATFTTPSGWIRLNSAVGGFEGATFTRTATGSEVTMDWAQNGARAAQVAFLEFPSDYLFRITPSGFGWSLNLGNGPFTVTIPAYDLPAATSIVAMGSTGTTPRSMTSTGSHAVLDDGLNNAPPESIALWIGIANTTGSVAGLSSTLTYAAAPLGESGNTAILAYRP